MGSGTYGKAIRRAVLLSVLPLFAGAAAADDILLETLSGPAPGQLTLRWSGTGPVFEVYRAAEPAAVLQPANRLGVTTALEWIDVPPDAPILYYLVVPGMTPACGNGVRETGEQCDDGNAANLDGCDAACAFEQLQRAIHFKMQFTTDTFCTANALGSAFVNGTIRDEFQGTLDAAVADGSLSLIFQALGVTDLSGTDEPAFELGFLTGLPETGGGTLPYNGTNDLDWWYRIDAAGIDPFRRPIRTLPASITARLLSAGPGTLDLPLFGVGAALRLAASRLAITVGSSSVPLVSAAGDPPGHLLSENLDPSLDSYSTCGTPDATGAGRLCGNGTARSLAAIPIPQSLVTNCGQGYTLSNSMLDAIVGGCTALFFVQLIRPTQPDTTDPGAPQPGAGPPYRLSADATRRVTTCRDRNGVLVDLNSCLDAAAYTSFFKLATDRVIGR